MTKQEIVNELRTYGVDATTRGRKATLEKLLMEVKDNAVTKPAVKTGTGWFIAATAGVLLGSLVAAQADDMMMDDMMMMSSNGAYVSVNTTEIGEVEGEGVTVGYLGNNIEANIEYFEGDAFGVLDTELTEIEVGGRKDFGNGFTGVAGVRDTELELTLNTASLAYGPAFSATDDQTEVYVGGEYRFNDYVSGRATIGSEDTTQFGVKVGGDTGFYGSYERTTYELEDFDGSNFDADKDTFSIGYKMKF